MQIRCYAKSYYALVELQKIERRTLVEIISTIILEAAEAAPARDDPAATAGRETA